MERRTKNHRHFKVLINTPSRRGSPGKEMKMSVYEDMTIKINAYTEAALCIEKIIGEPDYTVRGMIIGARNMRDGLTIEAAMMEVC